MRREDLEHLLRAAGTIVCDDDITVIGSQSILGTYTDDQLPSEVAYSMEADLLPTNDPGGRKADLIDGARSDRSPGRRAGRVRAPHRVRIART